MVNGREDLGERESPVVVRVHVREFALQPPQHKHPLAQDRRFAAQSVRSLVGGAPGAQAPARLADALVGSSAPRDGWGMPMRSEAMLPMPQAKTPTKNTMTTMTTTRPPCESGAKLP